MLKKFLWGLFLTGLAIFMFAVWLQNYYFVSDVAPRAGVVLEVWNKPPSRLAKELQLWKETVLRFEQDNPAIRIKGVEREFSPQEFVTAMAGGKGPDVMHVWISTLPILARQGFIAPLDGYLQNWDQKDYIPPSVWEPAQIEHKIYGVPRDTYFTVLFFRKDLFRAAGLDPEKPPRNWEELVTCAQRLTRPELGQYGLGLTPKTSSFMDFVWQNGGELVKRDNQGRWQARFDAPEVVQTLKFWRDLKWRFRVLPPSALPSHEDVAQMFALGRVAMMMGVAIELPTLINKYGLNLKDTGIAPLPAGPTGISATHAGGEVFIINSAIPPARQDAAWKYIQFELSPGNQLWKWVRMNELGMTIFPGAFSASTNLLNLPEFAMVKEEITHARNEPHLAEWPQIKDELDADALEAVFVDPRLDLAAYLAASNRRIQQAYLAQLPADPSARAVPAALAATVTVVAAAQSNTRAAVKAVKAPRVVRRRTSWR